MTRYALLALLAACMAAGCSLEEKQAIKTAAFTDLASDGSETETTARLTLTFDSDIAGLTAADITLDAGTTGAAISTLSKTGTGEYELTLSGVKASGEVSVTAAREGYIINGNPRMVQIFYYYPEPGIPVTFNSLTADGSAAATTTTLTLAFNRDIGGLVPADILLTPGLAKGTVSRISAGVYELAVGGIAESGLLSVTVSKGGHTVSGNPKTVHVYFVPGDNEVTFNSLTADGSEDETTARLLLTFDGDIDNLSLADITLNAGYTGSVKTLLMRTGAGEYELLVAGITASGEVSVTVTKAGYTVSGNPQITAVFYYPPPGIEVAFNGMTADGLETDGSETTTKLVLAFDKDIDDLSADDITLDAGETGAVKGTLANTGTGIYELAITGIFASGEVRVTVAKDGYDISGNPQTAEVFSNSPPELTEAVFNGMAADGSAAVTTTKLILVFDKDIGGLSAGDITLGSGATGAVRGALTRTGAGLYELAVTGITASGVVIVSVAKNGYNISGSPRTAGVYYSANAGL